MNNKLALSLLIVTVLLAISGCSSSTGDKSDSTPPPVPTGVNLESFEDGTAILNWSPVTDNELKGYYIYWSADAMVDSSTTTYQFVETNSSIVSDLSDDITYYFAVSSTDKSDNESALSLQVIGEFAPDTAPPAPTGLTIESFEDGTAFLSWSPVTDNELKGYNIYWSAGAMVDSLTTTYQSVETNSSIISNLSEDITYYFAVSSTDNSDNESVFSLQVSGKFEPEPDLSPPPGPVNFEITSIGNGSVNLNWSVVNVDDLKGYHIYWRGGAEADTLTANRMFVDSTSVTIVNLDYDTLYYFAVTAIDISGNESVFSAQLFGKPLNTTSPLPPTGLDISAENVNVPQISIYWDQNAEPDISHYNVYRAVSTADLDDEASIVGSVSQEYFIDSDVEVGILYYYRITAIDREGWESSYSSIVSDLILPSITLISPINFQRTTEQPTFRWEPAEGAVKYVVYLMSSRIGGEVWTTRIDGTTSQVLYTGTVNLISGNTYYWLVGAISKANVDPGKEKVNSESTVGTFVVKTE